MVFILVVLIFSIFMSYASYENSIHCEVLALVLMIIAGCSLLFLPVPFLINYIKDVAHICPSCQFLIGIRKRLNVNLEKIRQLFNFSK
uniref:LITAF domain-containing protein n=1 Tax=Acrobeloides nanus TaxID=290746 RepID=A0A914D253_9BILA